MSVLVDLLRFIAANEDLPRTLKRYAGHDRDAIGKLINAAALRLEEAEGGAVPESGAPAKKGGLKVRRASEVERLADEAAQEIDASMNESKAERDRKKKERAAAAAAEMEAQREEEAKGPPRTRLYSDGAARGNPGPAGAGAVIVSPGGHIVAKMGKFLGDNTNNFAEYMGLLLGLRRAKAMGIKEIEILSDSELMIRQLKGEYQVKAENLRPLYDEAKELLKAFPALLLRHIPREENSAADEMSNRAIDERL
jgi:ribonuclease HI